MFLLTTVKSIEVLTPEEVAFVLANRNAIKAIMLSRILETRGGSATIHFDAENNVRKIESVRVSYFQNA